MKIRRYDLDLPQEIDERMKKILDFEIEKGRAPKDASPRDFLLMALVQGLAMVEARQKAAEPRLVVSADEAAKEAAARWARQTRS